MTNNIFVKLNKIGSKKNPRTLVISTALQSSHFQEIILLAPGQHGLVSRDTLQEGVFTSQHYSLFRVLAETQVRETLEVIPEWVRV